MRHRNGLKRVAHQAVQFAPGLLGVEQINVDGTGMGHTLLDALFGDLVKGHAGWRRQGQAQNVGQMPADGFAFAVRVGCKQDAVALLASAFSSLTSFLLALDGDILRRKAVVHINAQLAGGQVTHVAHAGRNFIAPAQVFADGLCFGGGLL